MLTQAYWAVRRRLVAGEQESHVTREGRLAAWASQAACNINTLAAHSGVGLCVTGSYHAPQTFVFVCSCWPDDLAKALNPRMAAQIGLVLGTNQDPDVRRTGSVVTVEVQLPDAFRYTVRASGLPMRTGLRVSVGVTTLGKPHYVNFDSASYAHALIAGITGSGKTELLRSIIYALARQNSPSELGFIIVDGKMGLRYRSLSHLAHLLEPIIVDPALAVKASLWLSEEIERRKRLEPNEIAQQRRIVLVIDELRHIVATGGARFVDALSNVAEMGRAFGVHAIVTSQRPTKGTLGSMLTKVNLGLRIVGRVGTPEESSVATGQRQAGAERLAGRGDMLVGPALTRVQAAMVSDEDLRSLPSSPCHGLDLDNRDDLRFDPDGGSNGSGRPGPKIKPFTSEELAYALANPGVGIRAMQTNLGMGSERAARLRNEMARPVVQELAGMGYTVVSNGNGEGYPREGMTE